MAAEVDTITGSACEAVELGQVVPRPPSLKLCKIPPCQTFVPRAEPFNSCDQPRTRNPGGRISIGATREDSL